MENTLILDTLNKLMGYHIRTREFHWEAVPNHGLHTQIEDFDSDLYEFIDEIAEDAQCMFGKIAPGEITPELPESANFKDMLRDVRVLLATLKDQMQEKCWTGIVNCIDDFWHVVNKNIYLLG